SGRVKAGYLKAPIGQKQRERACSASDIQHPTRTELFRDRDVHIEVTAVGIERVVDGGEPRVLEYGIRHADNNGRKFQTRLRCPPCRVFPEGHTRSLPGGSRL